MILSSLMFAWLLGSTPASGAPSLVARLGSAHYADRERAAAELLELGPDAQDALRDGRHAHDPEVRGRAAAILERIQGQLMVRPTLVALDFRDRALIDVARVLGQRAGMPLEPEDPHQDPDFWQGRRVTLETPRPVPFWTALDRLCAAGSLRYNGGGARPFGPALAGGGLLLAPRPIDRAAAPTSDSGPFRVKLVQLHYERNRSFEEDADAPTEEFRVTLETWAEPRLLIAQSGPPELTEAIDELGRSLLPPDATAHRLAFAPVQGLIPMAAIEPYDLQPLGRGMVQIQTALNFPRSPNPTTVRRFRGLIPVAVAARKPDPVLVPLADAVGKTFGGEGDLRILVRGCKRSPDAEELTILELTAISRAASPSQPVAAGPDGPLAFPSLLTAPEHQIEVLDAQGRPVPWSPVDQETDADGVRLSLGIMPNDDSGTPTTLRVYDLSHATARVPFEFTDIRMP